jgi:hypothetical protein
MTYSHEEANARLLDLVYGEAAPGERVDLEAHVASCPRCQAALAALGGTRAVVRAALVDQPAPKGVHARLIQAATEAVAPAAAARASSVVAAAAPAPRARVAAPTEAPSFWLKVRRGWTLPTFATVGAFAILLLASKVFLSPQRTYERGQQGLIPAESAPAASARDVENAPAAPAASADKAPAPEGRAEPASAAGPRDRDDEALMRRQVALARERAVGAALGKSMRHDRGADGLSGSLGSESAQEAFGGPEWPHTGGGGKVPGLGNIRSVPGSVEGGKGVGAVGSGAANVGGLYGLKRGGASAPKPASRSAAAADDFAAPPAGWKKGGAPAPASPAPPPAPARRDLADDLERAAPPTAKADRRAVEEMDEMEAAPPRMKAEKATASEPPPAEKKKTASPPAAAKPQVAPAAPSAAAAGAPAAQAPAKDEPAKTASDAKERDATSARDVLARRAEQLFVARRWDEAVAAYRELLRRFPDADPAAKWRARMAQAERESAESAATKSATKKAASAPAEGM